MKFCNHNCNDFGNHCAYKTKDGQCTMKSFLQYTDHTDYKQANDCEKEGRQHDNS